LVSQLTQSAIAQGVIDPRGKTPEQIVKEAYDFYTNPLYEFSPIIDHTVVILKQARLFKRAGDKELACLFYALWLEHTLNKLISMLANKKKMPEKYIELLVRDTSYKSKASWMLTLLGAKPIGPTHANLIFKLMEARNAFVHYKWKPDSEQMEKDIVSLLGNIENTVKYVQRFETRYLLGVSKRQIDKAVRR